MDHFRLCEGDNGVIIMPPTDNRALFDLAFDLYEQQETRQDFMVAFRHQIMTDPATHDLFLQYACDRLIRGIAQECSRRAKASNREQTRAPRRPASTPVDTIIVPQQRTSREVLVEALQTYEHQRQQQEAMEKMVDESVQRHQQLPDDFAVGEQVLLIPGPGSEEIPGTVVSITPEQVIVHFVLIDGSVAEYPVSPQALQKQRHDDREVTDTSTGSHPAPHDDVGSHG
jgi:hypothetical protein